MAKRSQRPAGMSLAAIVAYELDRALPDGDCLIAQCATCDDGYARVSFERRCVRLHRLVLEVHLGRPLRPDEESRHTCHKRNCINPKHLIPGTHVENIHDMIRAGRKAPLDGEHNGRAKLSWEQVERIRKRYAAGGVIYRDLAREYGVSPALIGAIVRGEAWQPRQ